jgi:cytochrome c oxidase subunit IV
METNDRTDSDTQEHGEHAGAGLRTYLAIGLLLAVLTYVELQLPVMLEGDRPLLVTSLLVAAFLKAGLVMLFYMHLKFDSPVFSYIVVLALGLVGYFLWLLVY